TTHRQQIPPNLPVPIGNKCTVTAAQRRDKSVPLRWALLRRIRVACRFRLRCDCLIRDVYQTGIPKGVAARTDLLALARAPDASKGTVIDRLIAWRERSSIGQSGALVCRIHGCLTAPEGELQYKMRLRLIVNRGIAPCGESDRVSTKGTEIKSV